MDTKRLVTGTVVGGIVMFVVGYLVYGMALMDFFATNMGSATGVAREAPVFWALAVGNLAFAALITWAIMSQPGNVDAGNGFRLGATVMLLVWVGADFIMYATSNVSNLTATLVDPLISAGIGGVMGTAIAMVAGKKG